MRFPSSLPLAGLIALLSLPAGAATTYVAPLTAKSSCAKASGTLNCPWESLDQALNNANAGDRILLMDGKHGPLKTNLRFTKPVTIQSQSGKQAHIESADFGTARNIHLKNLSVWRKEGDWAGYLVRAYKGSEGLSFEGLDMRSRQNATSKEKWSARRWRSVAGFGFDLRGNGYTIRDNTVSGVRVGISAGYNSIVENNVVDGFSGDGLKGVGNSVFRNNLVKNRFRVDDFHADGFQAHTTSVIRNLTIDSNTFLEWTLAKDHPLRGYMQGIGMFDGFYEDLMIRNNIIAARASHGIAVYGTRRAKILSNTVVSLNGEPGKYPIIRVKPHKDGTYSKNVLVADNLAMGFDGSRNVVFTRNGVIVDPSSIFLDPANFDYRLKPNSGLKGKGATQALNLALSRLALSETAGSAAQSLFRAERADPLFSGATGRAGEVALAQEDPATVPLPAAGFGLLAALGALLTLRRRTARA